MRRSGNTAQAVALQLLLLTPLLALGKRTCTGSMGRLPGRDVDFGKDLETYRGVSSEGACFQLCLEYDKLTPAAPHGCLSSTYLPTKKTCVLKAVGEKNHRPQPSGCKICKGSVLLFCKPETFQCQSHAQSFVNRHSLHKNKAVADARECGQYCKDTPGCNAADFHMVSWDLEYYGGVYVRPRPAGTNCFLKRLPAGIEHEIGDLPKGFWPIESEIYDFLWKRTYTSCCTEHPVGSWTDTLWIKSTGYGCDCNVRQPAATAFGGIKECPDRVGLSCQSGRCGCKDGWYWNQEINQCMSAIKCRVPGAGWPGKYDLKAASKRVESSAACSQLCVNAPRCTAASWLAGKPVGTNCYLKAAPANAPEPAATDGATLLILHGSPVPCGTFGSAVCRLNSDCQTKGEVCIESTCGCAPIQHAMEAPPLYDLVFVDRPTGYDSTAQQCVECVNYKQCPGDELCTTRDELSLDRIPGSTTPVGLCTDRWEISYLFPDVVSPDLKRPW